MRLRKLASNAAYLTIDWVSITILSSLFWLTTAHILSPVELGTVSTAFNFASILQFISTLGISVALSKLISEYSGSGKVSKIPPIIDSGIKLLLISNVLLTIIIFIFTPNLSMAIKLAPAAILISVALAVFLSVSNFTGYIIIGFQDMKKLMLTDIFYHISKVVVSVIFIFLGFSFFGPLFGITLGLLFLILLRLDIFKTFTLQPKLQYKKEIFRYALPAFVGGIASLAFSNAPYIILTAIKDLSITGIFTPAMLLATPLFIFPAVFSGALFPIISSLSVGSRRSAEKSFLVNIVFRYTIFLTIPLAVFLIIFSSQVVTILFKPEYLPAVELLKILSIGALFQGLSGIFLNTIYALKKPMVQQNILIVISLFFVLLSLPLTFYFSVVGMSIAYVISTVTLFVISYFYVRKLVSVHLPYKDILKVVMATSFLIILLSIVKPTIPNPFSIILIVPGIVIYFLSLFYLNFYNALDLRLIGFLEKRAPRQIKLPMNIISRLLKNRLENTS